MSDTAPDLLNVTRQDAVVTRFLRAPGRRPLAEHQCVSVSWRKFDGVCQLQWSFVQVLPRRQLLALRRLVGDAQLDRGRETHQDGSPGDSLPRSQLQQWNMLDAAGRLADSSDTVSALCHQAGKRAGSHEVTYTRWYGILTLL